MGHLYQGKLSRSPAIRSDPPSFDPGKDMGARCSASAAHGASRDPATHLRNILSRSLIPINLVIHHVQDTLGTRQKIRGL
jgi:hypothetical protein